MRPAAQKHLLVIRFSALGDVAMTVPVVKNLLDQHPDLRITFVSTALAEPLFSDMKRCDFVAADLRGQHIGLWGMVKLFNQLRRTNQYDCVVDLHDVIRTKVLRLLFGLVNTRTVHIDKGRREKRQLTRRKNKIFRKLKSTFQRYADTFKLSGTAVVLDHHQPTLVKQNMPVEFRSEIIADKKLVGVAPFSKHQAKVYPVEKMKNILTRLNQTENVQLVLLGSRQEAATLEEWHNGLAGSVNIAGRFSFAEELAIISNLKLVVSMDSANVHLASLFGVSVLTIWGPTHPFAGFQGWGQPDSNNLQVDLPCRPCSVYGQKPCDCGDHECRVWMDEDLILKKIRDSL